MNWAHINEGDQYFDSSGDYRVTFVARFVAWSTVRVEPDNFRGTPGRRAHELTIHEGSIAVRNFRRG